MKANELYKELKRQAKTVDDKENTTLFVSETVSEYIRKQVREIIRKQTEEILLDLELGIIDKETAINEINVEKIICKSL